MTDLPSVLSGASKWSLVQGDCLEGTTKHVSVDFAVKVCGQFATGAIEVKDFASFTWDQPDKGAELERRLKAVGQ